MFHRKINFHSSRSLYLRQKIKKPLNVKKNITLKKLLAIQNKHILFCFYSCFIWQISLLIQSLTNGLLKVKNNLCIGITSINCYGKCKLRIYRSYFFLDKLLLRVEKWFLMILNINYFSGFQEQYQRMGETWLTLEAMSQLRFLCRLDRHMLVIY